MHRQRKGCTDGTDQVRKTPKAPTKECASGASLTYLVGAIFLIKLDPNRLRTRHLPKSQIPPKTNKYVIPDVPVGNTHPTVSDEYYCLEAMTWPAKVV